LKDKTISIKLFSLKKIHLHHDLPFHKWNVIDYPLYLSLIFSDDFLSSFNMRIEIWKKINFRIKMYKAKRICLNQNFKDQSEVFSFILTIKMKRHFVLFLGQI
jgi:hypothetical protein